MAEKGNEMGFLKDIYLFGLGLVLLFSFKGEVILTNPRTILWVAILLMIQTVIIFALTYFLAKK